jgi:hypothetical protein
VTGLLLLPAITTAAAASGSHIFKTTNLTLNARPTLKINPSIPFCRVPGGEGGRERRRASGLEEHPQGALKKVAWVIWGNQSTDNTSPAGVNSEEQRPPHLTTGPEEPFSNPGEGTADASSPIALC